MLVHEDESGKQPKERGNRGRSRLFTPLPPTPTSPFAAGWGHVSSSVQWAVGTSDTSHPEHDSPALCLCQGDLGVVG